MVQLELAPETEQRLNAAAAARGLAPEAYATELIESAIPQSVFDKQNTRQDIQEFLRKMALLGENIPHLPDYAYTRESFYEDHD